MGRPVQQSTAMIRQVPEHKTHSFKRTYSSVYQVTDTLVNRSVAFTLNSLPTYAEFTALFDTYRITRIDVNFIFDQNSGNVAASAGHAASFIPNLLMVNDFDDATALGAITDYEQYESFKISRLDRSLRTTFVPKLAVGAYGGAVFTNYARATGIWLDSASPAIEHYGIKFGVNGNMEGGVGTLNIGALSIYYTYHFQCCDTK